MRKLLTILAMSIIAHWYIGTLAHAQEFLGYSPSNYVGVYGVDLQPASIVDSRLAFDITFPFVGLNVDFNNNFLKNNILKLDTNFTKITKDKVKKFFFNTDLLAPAFTMHIKEKHFFAFSINFRGIANINNIAPSFAETLFDSIIFNDDTLSTFPFNDEDLNTDLNFRTMAWAELGLTYGTILYNEKEHFVKGAITLKYLKGIGAGYLDFHNKNAIVYGGDSVFLSDMDLSYGYSQGFSDLFDSTANPLDLLKDASRPSFGFDIGFVYEYRPDYRSYYYTMDGDSMNVRHDINKYKFKVGISLVDVGSIKFNTGQFSREFNIKNQMLNFSEIPDSATLQQLDSVLAAQFGGGTVGETFKMRLPTVFSLQLDYHIWKGFYANLTTWLAFRAKKTGVSQLSRITLSPRWEHKYFDYAIPVSIDGLGNFNVGLNIRLPVLLFAHLVVGTDNLLSFVSKSTNRANFYIGMKIPINRKLIKDKDGDGVSDKMDKCKKIPGTWEFQGCPGPDTIAPEIEPYIKIS